MKRLSDLTLALLLLPIALPICLIAAAAVRAETRGNPFFLQKRVGLNEEVFTLWKLRSMSKDTIDAGSHEVSPSQITRVGAFIRRTKIDELPQLVNVIFGHMSFVGPRPCLPSQTALIAERRTLAVFDGRPGITGLAQVSGIDMSTPELLAEVDSTYLRSRTLVGDFRLIALTAFGSGRGDAALKS